MKRSMNFRETLFVSIMLFGMFFGAGNLIFPAYIGQLAGRNLWSAAVGFLIIGVGMPLLGVASIGMSRSNGLQDLSCKVGKGYSYFFTCALYLTIGPFFAIPRCATVPFTMGVEPLLGSADNRLALPIFSLIFFLIVLLVSLRPGQILLSVGKILTPVFLVVFSIIIITALVRPMGSAAAVEPAAAYVGSGAFFQGLQDGYGTMDALASLAFGIVVINVIRGFGIEDPSDVAKGTALAGIFSCLVMAVVYVATIVVGAQSRAVLEQFENGGQVLAAVARHYYGTAGMLIFAAAAVLACLKTSIGLVTSCSETFAAMFPHGPGYKTWAAIFSGVAFLIANLGLTTIISYSVPVLTFLYPLAITLSLMGLLGRSFRYDRAVFVSVTAFTLPAAAVDLLHSLPDGARAVLHCDGLVDAVYKVLPFSKQGLGWVCPALAGLVVGLIIHAARGGNKRFDQA